MALNDGLWAQLDNTFQQDIPATDQLLALLQRERKALEQRDYEEFQQIINDKQPLLALLQSHAATRQQLLTAAGFDSESNTLNAVQQQAPLVAKAWHTLSAQWARCQELNEVNERIAKRTRLVVGQILDLMRGQQGQARLYTDKGNTSSGGGGRTITSA